MARGRSTRARSLRYQKLQLDGAEPKETSILTFASCRCRRLIHLQLPGPAAFSLRSWHCFYSGSSRENSVPRLFVFLASPFGRGSLHRSSVRDAVLLFSLATITQLFCRALRRGSRTFQRIAQSTTFLLSPLPLRWPTIACAIPS